MNARRWQRPTGRALALTVFGVALFTGLGVWQWQRANEKERLLAMLRSAPNEPTIDLGAVADLADPSRSPHVRVRGRYLTARGYLLDEQIHAGQPGVDVIGVFAPRGEARLLLVDRGWIGWNHAPGTLPAVPAPVGEEIELQGLYAPYPGGGLRLGGNALPGQAGWPKLTLRLDPAEIAADLGQPLLPRVLLLDPQPAVGLLRDWKPAVLPPERHRAYAVQWWLFAAIAFGIFVGQHWRKSESGRR
jgi:cytochrome oxidase assembly protein ShyY1